MKTFCYIIKDEIGIHARPAGLLAKEAKKYAADTTVKAHGKSADAGRLMALMSLGVKCGDQVEVEITGEEEDAAYMGLKRFFEENL